MGHPAQTRQAPSDHISELVRTALAQTQLSGLSEMLRLIAESVEADACILWQVSPTAIVEPPKGRIFILANWCQESIRGQALDALPLDASVTGQAILRNEIRIVADVDAEAVHRDTFLIGAGIRTFCSIPTGLEDGPAAVNLYRIAPRPLRKPDIRRASQLIRLLPALYQSLRDKVAYDLIADINTVLHEAELSAPESPTRKDAKNVLTSLCRRVSHSFGCLETSVFLEDPVEEQKRYLLMGTSWMGRFSKRSYLRDPEDGITGWVLAHAKPVKILDFAALAHEPIDREYPGLRWRDSLDIKSHVRKELRLKPGAELPPLSFMAVPIVKGAQVQGVIRCSVATHGPFYFADRELRLLELVASLISRYWSSWLNRRMLQEDIRSLRALVESIRELNDFVHAELARETVDEHRIFDEALRVTRDVIHGAEITDVRLLDDDKKELFFVAIHGSAWNEGTAQEVRERRQRRFPVGTDPPASAGAYVMATGEVYEIADVKEDAFYFESFKDTRRMMIAPLSIGQRGGGELYGLLDIRWTSKREFPRYAKPMAALFGSQLALYRFLALTIGELRSAMAERIQVFQDLDHQLKTPLTQAHARVQRVLWAFREDPPGSVEFLGNAEKTRGELWAIRGLVAKAKRVSFNSKLFTTLARNEPLKIRKQKISGDDLLLLLIEAGQDNRLLVNSRLGISSFVEPEGFEGVSLEADRNLLEQAVSNVLHNAFKYSYPKTRVEVSARSTKTGRLGIAFCNEGIPIEKQEILRCRERGWQGELAKAVSEGGGGSGIGLWIVDHIMRAHGGELIVNPTRENETVIELFFCRGQ